MNSSIFSIAYLEYMHEVLNKDIIDSYIPMFCECLLKQSSDVVDLQVLRKAMEELYGISNLTVGAISSICDRMASGDNSLLKRDHGQLLINRANLGQYHVALKKDDRILSDYDRLVAEISEYSKKFMKEYSKEEVSEGLLQFLETHDIDLVTQQNTAVLQKITSHDDKRLAYVIARYVLDSEKTGGDALNILTRLAKGNAITNLVCLSGLNSYAGKLDDVHVYIDTPFFYDLLGANGNPNKEAAEELMSILQSNGACFAMFRHNYNEVYTNLEDVINKLQLGNYDLRNCSRLLRMAVTEHFSSIQMQVMLSNVDVVIAKWGVTIPENPDLPVGYYDVDRGELEKIITEQYTNHRTRTLFTHELNMMNIDIDSIVFTYRLRGNDVARSLKTSKAILLTTNRAIAKASNEPSVNVYNHKIPVCTTDMFLSTILWTNYPRKNDQLNRKLLISECFNTIQLNDTLFARFFEDVKEKKIAEDITESQYLALTTSKLALSLLGDKTLNDINAYTDRTAAEILDILEQEHKDEVESIRQEARDKIAEVSKSSEEEIAKIKSEHAVNLAEKNLEISTLTQKIDSLCEQYREEAKIFANICSFILAVILACLFLVRGQSVDAYLHNHKVLNCIWCGLKILLSLWGFFNWIGLIPKFADLKTLIYNKRYNYLHKKYLEK